MTDLTTQANTALFASAGFRRYFLASCFSTFAIWISRFLLGWTAWALTESAFWVGAVSALFLAPTFLFSLVFGVVADRVNPLRGMHLTTAAQALIGVAAAVTAGLDLFTLPWLCTLAAAIGVVTAAHHPMRLSLLPLLVERRHFAAAIGLSAMVFNTSRILGPALAAFLLWWASTAVAFGVAAALYAATVLCLMRVHSLKPSPKEERRSLWVELRAGLAFVRASQMIRLLMLLTMINGLYGRTIIEMLPALTGQLLRGDAGTLAVVTGAAGLGSIVGGLLVSRQRGTEAHLLGLVFSALLASAVVTLPIMWVSTLIALGLLIFLLSLCMTVIGTGCQTAIQLSVADAFRGRVMSIWTVITMGMPAIGAILLGALADNFGMALMLLIFALMAGIVTLILHSWRRSVGL
ncbi:MFS transporter [Salinispirillum sp. LH 10-3-1]|uniref:MFS transporter n=1 Tax=Salinispirillum sp. LH 10-3-1 TaxID=2952525 RepID=A0AB38YDI2_9GAMM